jgi:predicted enzyme related to lactoylglutathione lyase
MKTSSDKEKKWTEWFEIPVTDMERAKGFLRNRFETDIFLNDLGPNFKMVISFHKDVGCALC